MSQFIHAYVIDKHSQLPDFVTREDIIYYLDKSPDTSFLQKYKLNFKKATKQQLLCVLGKLQDYLHLKCLINISRSCGDNKIKFSFSKQPQYSLKQLENLWQSQCKHIEQFKHQQPKTVNQYCSLLRNRYDKYLLQAVFKVPPATKKIIAKVNKDTTLPSVHSSKISIKLLKISQYDNRELFKRIDTNGFSIFEQSFSLDKFKQKSTNKNLHNFTPECFAWLQTQNDFLLNLPWKEKIRIVGYTYGGDKICNNYILGSIDYKKITNKFHDYERLYIFPLAFEIYIDFLKYASYTDWMNSLIPVKVHAAFRKMFKLTFDALQLVPSYNYAAYNLIYKFIDAVAPKIKPQGWIRWIESFIEEITKIINKAPPTPKDSFYVYRGVQDKSFVTFDSKNVFTNNLFMSTSLSIDVAYGFKNPLSKCCVFEMQVLQNTQCLFITPVSYFSDELEILFAPGRHLLKTGTEHLDSENRMWITNFTILN